MKTSIKKDLETAKELVARLEAAIAELEQPRPDVPPRPVRLTKPRTMRRVTG